MSLRDRHSRFAFKRQDDDDNGLEPRATAVLLSNAPRITESVLGSPPLAAEHVQCCAWIRAGPLPQQILTLEPASRHDGSVGSSTGSGFREMSICIWLAAGQPPQEAQTSPNGCLGEPSVDRPASAALVLHHPIL